MFGGHGGFWVEGIPGVLDLKDPEDCQCVGKEGILGREDQRILRVLRPEDFGFLGASVAFLVFTKEEV